MASKGLRHTVLHIFKHFWACGESNFQFCFVIFLLFNFRFTIGETFVMAYLPDR